MRLNKKNKNEWRKKKTDRWIWRVGGSLQRLIIALQSREYSRENRAAHQYMSDMMPDIWSFLNCSWIRKKWIVGLRVLLCAQTSHSIWLSFLFFSRLHCYLVKRPFVSVTRSLHCRYRFHLLAFLCYDAEDQENWSSFIMSNKIGYRTIHSPMDFHFEPVSLQTTNNGLICIYTTGPTTSALTNALIETFSWPRLWRTY